MKIIITVRRTIVEYAVIEREVNPDTLDLKGIVDEIDYAAMCGDVEWDEDNAVVNTGTFLIEDDNNNILFEDYDAGSSD